MGALYGLVRESHNITMVCEYLLLQAQRLVIVVLYASGELHTPYIIVSKDQGLLPMRGGCLWWEEGPRKFNLLRL